MLFARVRGGVASPSPSSGRSGGSGSEIARSRFFGRSCTSSSCTDWVGSRLDDHSRLFASTACETDLDEREAGLNLLWVWAHLYCNRPIAHGVHSTYAYLEFG